MEFSVNLGPTTCIFAEVQLAYFIPRARRALYFENWSFTLQQGIHWVYSSTYWLDDKYISAVSRCSGYIPSRVTQGFFLYSYTSRFKLPSVFYEIKIYHFSPNCSLHYNWRVSYLRISIWVELETYWFLLNSSYKINSHAISFSAFILFSYLNQ